MSRRAVTTVELLVALLIGGIVAGAIAVVLQRQQRFFSRASALVEHRRSLRDATGMLPAELRGLSPTGGDVLAFSDSTIEIRATIGVGIACDTVVGGGAIDLAPASSLRSQTLTAFTLTPQPGDAALVFDAGVPDDSVDDVWIAREVSGVATAPPSAACVTSPLLGSEDAGEPRLRLRFDAGARLPPSVRPGAFVHVLRRVRYRLYRAAAGDWYLGYAEWDGTAYSVIQPVSGPFASYSTSAGTTGLLMRYFDAAGSPIASLPDASRITRVEVVARAVSGTGLSGATSSFIDAQAVTVRMRNQ